MLHMVDDHFEVKGMIGRGVLHWLLSSLGCSAIAVNCLLVMLIVTRSESMRSYKYYLLNLAIADLVSAIALTLLQPLPFFVGPVKAAVILGPVQYVSWSLLGHLTMLLILASLCYSTFALALTFVYRYLCLCDRKHEGIWKRPGLLIAFSVLYSLMMMLVLHMARLNDDPLPALIKRYPEMSEEKGQLIVFGYHSGGWLASSNALAISCNIGCDVVMSVCGYRILCTLHSHRHEMSPRTYRMHHRLFIALVCQALIPLTVFCVPVVVFVGSILFDVDFGLTLNWIIVCLIALHPLLNPLITIAFVAPYRRACFSRCIDFERSSDIAHTPFLTPKPSSRTDKSKLVDEQNNLIISVIVQGNK